MAEYEPNRTNGYGNPVEHSTTQQTSDGIELSLPLQDTQGLGQTLESPEEIGEESNPQIIIDGWAKLF